jgi:NCAIR mutase (PurE)-related protein
LDVANEKMKDFLRNSALDTISKGLDSLGLNSLKIFTDIDKNGQTTFGKLFEAAKTSGEQFAVVFQGVGDVFQDVMNMMAQASQARFDREREQLAQETEIALAFAGESDTARAEIERQAEARRKEIARREFKAKKEQAIFNIAIDTAQAIVGIWAQVPKYDYGISAGLLTAFVGVLGLAQIAMVQSQQPPAYKMGTDNHIGGAMLVNDGAGSNYKETIQTPDGKIYQPKERNVIMNAPKGTKVFTHDQWQRNLDNILTSNSINYSQPNVVVNSGMSDEQVDRIVNTIANKQEAILSIDKNGWNTSVRNGHTQKEILNNQVTFGR